MIFRFPKTLVLLLAALPLFAQNRDTRDTHEGHEVAGNQVIIKVRAPVASILQQLRQFADADDLRALNGPLGLYLLHSRSGTVAVLLAVLQSHPSVAYVEPDYILKTTTTPSDPNFSQQWSFLNTAMPGADIGATLAWDVSTGSTANVVGIVDTGIDYTHPDLAANVWSAPAPFTVTLSWGTITCPAGSHGYNAIARTCDPRDDSYHGTHVSGTVGAIGNNAAGVAGVNWTTRIMGLKFLDATGSGRTSDAIDAMEFAMQTKTVFGAAGNVRVLSNSWGGSGYSQALLAEINKANANEMLFVAAAGNNAQNVDTTPQYPAAFNAPNLVSVAATTNTDSLASFSNWGKNSVHLGAPGVDILSTLPGGAYGFLSGTSMATPHVSGAAMLLLSKCSLNTAALKSVLLSNVDALSSLAGITVTGGRLNVNKALRSCAGTITPPSGTATLLKTDSTTSGTWKGVYGGEGAVVIGDSASTPGYVTVTPSGTFAHTWAAPTTDSRAPQTIASASDRVAACWYSEGVFSIDLKFIDQKSHQVALYLLDWDNYYGRVERVDILDATTNAVLNTRSVSGFTGGQYLVWNLSGHVVVRVVNLNGPSNAVMSGLFFGTGGSSVAPNSAAFLKTDTTTLGTWKGVYGAEGSNVIGDATSYPTYATVTPSASWPHTWVGSTTDVRALQKSSSTSDRTAACWYSEGAFTVDMAFSDSNTHQVALYLLDFDYYNGRTERVDILDATTNAVLDTRFVSAFTGGQYLVWNLSGHVIVRITNTNPLSNAVMSGIFFR